MSGDFSRRCRESCATSSARGLIHARHGCILRGCQGQSSSKRSKIPTPAVTTRSTWIARSSPPFVRSAESRATPRSWRCSNEVPRTSELFVSLTFRRRSASSSRASSSICGATGTMESSTSGQSTESSTTWSRAHPQSGCESSVTSTSGAALSP